MPDDLYVNNLAGDIKANPRDFYRYINSQKKDTQGIPPLKRRNGSGLAVSELEQARNLTVTLRMCSTKANIAKSPALIVRLLSWRNLMFQLKV